MSILKQSIGLVLAAILPVCQALPSAKVDYQGLGQSKIADIIIDHWQIAPERYLKPKLEKALQKHARGAAIDLEIAQQFGFRCERSLLSCVYLGTLSYHLSGVPEANRANAEKVLVFEIQIIEVQPLAVRVQIKHSSPLKVQKDY